MSNAVTYNTTTNILYMGDLRETQSISVPMISNQRDGFYLKGILVEEPTYVNHMELTPTGDLHVHQVVENKYWNNSGSRELIICQDSVTLTDSICDSYNSFDPNYSTNGLYDETKRKATAMVAVSSSLNNTITLSALTKVYGYLGTIGAPSYNIGPNASVGDILWITSGNTGVQPTHVNYSLFGDIYPISDPRAGQKVINFDPVTIDWSGAITASQTSVTQSGVGYKWLVGNGKYFLPSFVATDNILVVGNATILTNTNVVAQYINVSPGSSLKWYHAAKFFSFANVLLSQEVSFNFQLYTAGNALTVNWNPTSSLSTAMILDAPTTDVTISGTGTRNFMGRIRAKTLTAAGKTNFHFDENLKRF